MVCVKSEVASLPSAGSVLSALLLTRSSGVPQLTVDSRCQSDQVKPRQTDWSQCFAPCCSSGDYPALTNQTPSTLKMISGSKEALAAMQIRKQELAVSTAAIGLPSAGYFAPVVRVRPAVNLVKGRMKQLAACAVARGPRRGPKLAKLAREIGRVLVDEVGPECMRMIEQSDGRAKLIANAPLELLPIRDLPMQLRYTVSRVPVLRLLTYF